MAKIINHIVIKHKVYTYEFGYKTEGGDVIILETVKKANKISKKGLDELEERLGMKTLGVRTEIKRYAMPEERIFECCIELEDENNG